MASQRISRSFSNKKVTQDGISNAEISNAEHLEGRANANDKISKTPVIFIHGNSDLGFGRGKADGYASWQTGFR